MFDTTEYASERNYEAEQKMNNNLFRENQYPNMSNMPIPDMRLAGFNMQPPIFNPNFNHYLSTMMLNESTVNHRRHTARESTGPLKGWLQEHPRNPYPTKAEKVMLALISGMTLTQVSTWFANARRRLKKENSLKDDEDDKTESSLDHENDVAVYSSPSVIEERKQFENGSTTVEKKPNEVSKIWRIVDELEKVS